MNIGGTEFKFRSCWKGKTEIMVLTIVGFLVILILMGIWGLMIVGKFARLEREVNEVFDKVYDDIQEIQGVVGAFMDDFKNLKTDFSNLPKPPENLDLVSEQITQMLTKVKTLEETQNSLRSDVNLLFKADDEHPVTTVIGVSTKPGNKGGRPPKEGR